jgi:hypothetical protein
VEANPFEFVSDSYDPSAATCPKTYSIIHSATSAAYAGTWVTVTATGGLKVNRNLYGSEVLKVRVAYDGVNYDTAAITVTGNCPTTTVVSISGSPFNYVLPNSATVP